MTKKVLKEHEQQEIEISKAKELFGSLIDSHIEHAAKCRTEEVWNMSFAFRFERDAHATKIQAKVSYSKKFSEMFEGVASPYTQPDLLNTFPSDEADSLP